MYFKVYFPSRKSIRLQSIDTAGSTLVSFLSCLIVTIVLKQFLCISNSSGAAVISLPSCLWTKASMSICIRKKAFYFQSRLSQVSIFWPQKSEIFIKKPLSIKPKGIFASASKQKTAISNLSDKNGCMTAELFIDYTAKNRMCQAPNETTSMTN